MSADSVNVVLSCTGMHVSAEGGCIIVSGIQRITLMVSILERHLKQEVI